MSVLRKIIALLLSIIWVVCTTGLILVSTFLYLLRSSESLTANMRATLMFQPALVSLVNTIVLRSAQEQGVPPQAAVDESIISALLPPDGFDGVINSAVDNFYTALQIGDIRRAVFLIDKQPFFTHWQSPAGQIALADLLTVLPICPEPTDSLPINIRATSPQTIFSCVSSEIGTYEIAAQIQQTIEPPRERFLRVPFGALASFRWGNWLYNWETLFGTLHYFFIWGNWLWTGWFITACLLLLILRLVGKAGGSRLRWLGWLWISVGSLCLGVGGSGWTSGRVAMRYTVLATDWNKTDWGYSYILQFLELITTALLTYWLGYILLAATIAFTIAFFSLVGHHLYRYWYHSVPRQRRLQR